MFSILHDIRFGMRMLFKTPAFTIIALMTLALGIGVNTATYSVLQAMRPQMEEFHNPDELVFLWGSTPTGSNINISLDDWLDWHDQSESFAEMSVFNLSSSI
ncbi:MAG: ABC transporter permease, partial [Planctomycetes bacterium]|nr:ABC transporter permease [Planctomycetota bacterium]